MDGTDPNDPLAGATAAYYGYAEPVDKARPGDFAALFTAEGVFLDDAVVGPEAIAKRCRALLRQLDATSHHLSNIRIVSASAGETEARAYVYAWHQFTGGKMVEAWGRYQSKLRYEKGRWRLGEHRFQAAGVRPPGGLGPGAPVPRADV
ncbi:MAG: nuclear transport factor 2 family protein [Actinomycetia bacterium]|nr:nuclear transport factor 2 family protein [Actinomycetes bacterium]